MAAPKGHPRYGGRKKGTPNKSSTANKERFKEVNLDPFEEMLALAQQAEDPNIRFGMMKELAQYCYPKLKSIEISGDIDVDLAQKASEYAKLSKEEQIELMEQEVSRLKRELENK